MLLTEHVSGFFLSFFTSFPDREPIEGALLARFPVSLPPFKGSSVQSSERSNRFVLVHSVTREGKKKERASLLKLEGRAPVAKT